MKSSLRHSLITCCITVCEISTLGAQAFLCAGHAPNGPLSAAKIAADVRLPVLPARGSIYILTIFARFADEEPTPVPEWADQLFDAEREGSFAHFYHTASFGQLAIVGEVLPQRFAASQPASAYLADAPGQRGHYGDFAREILTQVDAQIDLARFDNDGPDGVPNSGDDDGWVDYIFINMQSVPNGFLLGSATGLARLGLNEKPFVSRALGPDGSPIRVSGLPSQGAIQEAGNFAQTVGVMAHEFGHGLGLSDFFDTSFLRNPAQDPAEDSAGIGRWGLMGWGAHGWDGMSGPVAFSARSLEQLGWIGAKNERLILVQRDSRDLRMRDLYSGGAIYKIPLRAETPNNNTLWAEYLLLEYRGRGNYYYHRGEPASGLLVWHVRPQVFDNDDERRKHLDLVAADGQYADAGFPIGQTADPFSGRDNLDFWAHDASYARARGGNLGDASDLFDGVRYRRLAIGTNPSTLATPTLSQATTGLALQNMRPDGDGLALDVVMPRWGGVLREEVHWAGEVLIDGDLTVAPAGRLVVFRNTQIRVAGSDRLQMGLDPERTEIHVHGDFVIRSAAVSQIANTLHVHPDTTRFLAAVPGEQWAGIFIEPSPTSELTFPIGSYEIVDAVRGLVVRGVPAVEDLVIHGFLSAQAEEAAGRGTIAPGVRIPLALKVENHSPLTFIANARAFIEWNNPLLHPSSGAGRSRTVSFPPGEKNVFFFGPDPTLNKDATPGTEVVFTVRVEKDGVPIWWDTFAIVVADAPIALLDAFALLHNFPNPFNAKTQIAYRLPREVRVRLTVFNASGQPVRQLVNAMQAAGTHRVTWDGQDDRGSTVATGVYFYRFAAGPFYQARSMILLK